MNSLSSTLSEDETLNQLLDYCEDHEIYISPCIAPRRFPGRGLGIYATEPILKGQKLMHVPATALLTVDSVPENFVDKHTREKITVHGLLAAYLAFGLGSEKENPYSRWMATWPALADFVTMMPMFWPQQSNLSLDGKGKEVENGAERAPKKPRHDKPTSIDPSKKHPHIVPSTAQAFSNHQLFKFQTSLKILSTSVPHLSSITDPHHPSYWKFVHAWCSVNTRCFYYLQPSQPPPEDSNEAMALCPGMDLFNHTDTANSGCTTYYDTDGYFVVTDRAFEAGEEVFLNYGRHNNDTLWTEYGFMMDENEDDAVKIDDVVLRDVGMVEQGWLEEEVYLGEYWLMPEGVCWRTEVVAWLGVLDEKRWRSFMKGEYDPESDLERNMLDGGTDEVNRVLKAKRKIVEWILRARENAEQGLKDSISMTGKELLARLAEDVSMLKAQDEKDEMDVERVRTLRGKQRREMCIQRCKQVWEMCTSALRAIEDDHPGSFVINKEGRREEDLETTVDDFCETIALPER